MPGGFQSQVNVQPNPAVAGDFASANPRATFDAGPGGLVTGTAGASVALFGWTAPPIDPNGTNILVNNFGTGNPAGICHREQQGLITTFLSDASQLIPAGFPLTLFTQGDFWVKNDGTTIASVGQKAYARYADGKVIFANAGTTQFANTSCTGSIGPQVSTFTGSISGNVLTVTASTGQVLVPGCVVSGTGGGGVATGTTIVSQSSGSVGGTGVYLVNISEQTVTSTAMTGAYALLTVGGTGQTGVLGVGDLISGSGVTVGTYISALGTGTGTGAGTYYLSGPNNLQIVASATVNVDIATETKWYAASNGLAGELVKITSWVGSQG